MELSAVEARVIASLAEKQLTTPQLYPLTLNALVLACNQSSNRDPVVAYDELTVESALISLKEAGLLRFVHPSQGRSATRYRQVLDERFGLDARGLSVLAVLMLRGPQTAGELRARTERMADFGNLDDVESELERLSDGPDPLVRRRSRHPGQKEDRWTELLTGGSPEPAVSPSAVSPSAGSPSAGSGTGSGTGVSDAAPPVRSVSLGDEVASLRADLVALQEEVGAIRAVVDELRAAFDL